MPNAEPVPELLIRREGRAGRITLNRPSRLNALTHGICRAISAALEAWREDVSVALVIFDAAGERAFCAGGDIIAVTKAAQAGDFDAGRAFFRDEYRMNAQIALFPKPVVAFMQGYTMGGGVGIGGHASRRIIGATTQIAMPETRIGLVPDVGASALLARAPGKSGYYLGLTGARLVPGDAIWSGFADRLIPETDWPALITALCTQGDPGILPEGDAAAAKLSADLAQIDRIFTEPTLPGIRAALAGESGRIAEATDQALRDFDPLAMAATLKLIRAAKLTPGVIPALEREFRYTSRAAESGDFIEGVRARLIDRDDRPAWRTAGMDAAALQEQVDLMLAPAAGLILPT